MNFEQLKELAREHRIYLRRYDNLGGRGRHYGVLREGSTQDLAVLKTQQQLQRFLTHFLNPGSGRSRLLRGVRREHLLELGIIVCRRSSLGYHFTYDDGRSDSTTTYWNFVPALIDILYVTRNLSRYLDFRRGRQSRQATQRRLPFSRGIPTPLGLRSRGKDLENEFFRRMTWGEFRTTY